MDRVIIYPGSIPLETDLLQAQKNSMIAVSKLGEAILGQATRVIGLQCVPTAPASLQVYVTPGQIYQMGSIDATAYSSLAADTTHSIMKQGILLDQASLDCPAPGTPGQSINYLIQAEFLEVDSAPVVLPYYNAANPASAFSGPNNAGTTQNTARKGAVNVVVKAGAAAATGTQLTPSADAGFVPLYVVTVANGQTQITTSSIAVHSSSPVIPLNVYGLDTGAANAYAVATGSSTIIKGTRVTFIAGNTNTGVSTLNIDGLGAKTIKKQGSYDLDSGDVTAGQVVTVVYDGTNFQLVSPVSRVFGRKNYLINGNFDIWQRGTALAADGSANRRHLADRWCTRGSGSTITPSALAALGDGNISTYAHRCVVSSIAGASNFAWLGQFIESVKTLNGRTATLSFWAKADASKNMAVMFQQFFGTPGGSPSDPVTFGVTTIPLTTNWQKFTITVAIPSIIGKTIASTGDDCLRVHFWFDSGSGSASQTNTLGQQSGTFDIMQVQLEEGSVATGFEYRTPAQELTLCQRYCEIGSQAYFINGPVGVSGKGLNVQFKATKRATPTLTIYDDQNSPGKVTVVNDTGSGIQAGITPSTTVVNTTCFAVMASTTSSSSGIYIKNWTADSEL